MGRVSTATVQTLPASLPAGFDQRRQVGAPTLPTLDGLAEVLPGGRLKKGTTITVEGGMSLALALLAGPSAAGLWGAIVGVPEIGLAAAGELGVDLDRLVLIPHAGDTWATVVAALADAIDVVIVRPPGPVSGNDARRLAARVRQRGSVLVCLGEWEGADLRLTATAHHWAGLGDGHGRLRWHAMTIRTSGRGAAAVLRTKRVWLQPPAPVPLPGVVLEPDRPRETAGHFRPSAGQRG